MVSRWVPGRQCLNSQFRLLVAFFHNILAGWLIWVQPPPDVLGGWRFCFLRADSNTQLEATRRYLRPVKTWPSPFQQQSQVCLHLTDSSCWSLGQPDLLAVAFLQAGFLHFWREASSVWVRGFLRSGMNPSTTFSMVRPSCTSLTSRTGRWPTTESKSFSCSAPEAFLKKKKIS